jgi:NO-binding membrane sensor protein with MHYT domain
MIEFLTDLKSRNESLFYFGLMCLSCAVLILLAAKFSHPQVNGVNAWYKPFKFALSIGIFCWTMGWYTAYLQLHSQIRLYSWATIILLGFELGYITLQAARGQLSHYNVSSPLYTSLTTAMALAAIAATLYTGYIGVLFCTEPFPELPDYYLWSIRISIFLFVIFAFEGGVMGANNSHTVGGTGDGLPLLNWSRKFGDLRIAHFVGMHALQVLPIIAYYVLKDIKSVFILGFIYGALALFCLLHALNGKPFIKLV